MSECGRETQANDKRRREVASRKHSAFAVACLLVAILFRCAASASQKPTKKRTFLLLQIAMAPNATAQSVSMRILFPREFPAVNHECREFPMFKTSARCPYNGAMVEVGERRKVCEHKICKFQDYKHRRRLPKCDNRADRGLVESKRRPRRFYGRPDCA